MLSACSRTNKINITNISGKEVTNKQITQSLLCSVLPFIFDLQSSMLHILNTGVHIYYVMTLTDFVFLEMNPIVRAPMWILDIGALLMSLILQRTSFKNDHSFGSCCD